jgi:hypothetical protein
MISLGSLHETGWLYQAVSVWKIRSIMKDEKIVMTGEKISSCLYKLQASVVVAGVVKDGYAGIAMHNPGGGNEPSIGLSGGSA